MLAAVALSAIFSACTPPMMMPPIVSNRVCATRSTSTTPENSDDFVTISSAAGLIARCEPGVFPKVCVCSTGRRFALVLTSADDYLNRLEATCFANGMCPLYNDDVVDVPRPPVDAVADAPTNRDDARPDADAAMTDPDADRDSASEEGGAMDGSPSSDASADASMDGSLDSAMAVVDAR